MTTTAEPAGTWIRVSSGGQDEQNQVPDIDRHVESRGYDVKRRYVLHDRSAFKGEQDGMLNEMLSDVRAGIIRVVVVWHSDRLERRGGRELLNLIAAVRDAGGRIESVLEPTLGALDIGGQVLTFLSGVMANAESVKKAERQRISDEKITKNGGLNSRAPWGYVSSGAGHPRPCACKWNHKLVPTDDGLKYIPQIFAKVTAGDSLATVARWLTAEGVTPPITEVKDRATGVKRPTTGWHAATVGTIIRNRTYAGTQMDQHGKPLDQRNVTHRCDPLVDVATWNRANAALTAARTRTDRGPGSVKPRAEQALLTGVLRCWACFDRGVDSPMYKVQAGGKRPAKFAYYRCTGRGADRHGCGAPVIPLPVADELIDVFVSSMSLPEVDVTHTPGKNYDAELEAVRFELEQLPRLGLDEDAEDKRRAELRAERKRLAGLEVTPDRWERKPTGRTIGEVWQAMDTAGRRGWLRDAEMVFVAGKRDGMFTVGVGWSDEAARAAA